MIDVLLVDDHELVRTGFEHLLNATPGIRVVAVAGSGEEALSKIHLLKPTIILMDLAMPGMGGLEASKRIMHSYPAIKLIVLTAYDDGPLPQQLLQMGVHGYLSKSSTISEMVNAIQMVCDGKRYVGSDVASKIVLSSVPGDEMPFNRLSQRELEIVLQILQGVSIQDIASRLLISAKTVNTYRYRVHQKLGVKSDVEVAHLAHKYNLL